MMNEKREDETELCNLGQKKQRHLCHTPLLPQWALSLVVQLKGSRNVTLTVILRQRKKEEETHGGRSQGCDGLAQQPRSLPRVTRSNFIFQLDS